MRWKLTREKDLETAHIVKKITICFHLYGLRTKHPAGGFKATYRYIYSYSIPGRFLLLRTPATELLHLSCIDSWTGCSGILNIQSRGEKKEDSVNHSQGIEEGTADGKKHREKLYMKTDMRAFLALYFEETFLDQFDPASGICSQMILSV